LPGPALSELPSVKGWTVLMVMSPPFEEIAAAEVMARQRAARF